MVWRKKRDFSMSQNLKVINAEANIIYAFPLLNRLLKSDSDIWFPIPHISWKRILNCLRHWNESENIYFFDNRFVIWKIRESQIITYIISFSFHFWLNDNPDSLFKILLMLSYTPLKCFFFFLWEKVSSVLWFLSSLSSESR